MQNVTAAQAVVQTAAADPTTLAQADNIVKAVQSKLLINTLTGNLNVKGLAADPTIQASFVPLLEAASLASGPLWTAVNPPPAPVASVGLTPRPSMHVRHAPPVPLLEAPPPPLGCCAINSWVGRRRSSRMLRTYCVQGDCDPCRAPRPQQRW